MSSEPATEGNAAEDTPLQAAVWLIEDMGLRMPPIPHVYADQIGELSTGRVFGTSEDIATLTTPSAIERRLYDGEWPLPGLAFGFLPVGTGGIWFYTLVSEQILIQISIRIRYASEDTIATGRGEINLAHYLLEKYLSDEVNYFRVLSTVPKGDGLPREIVSYSNEPGLVIERAASWTGPGTLSDFRQKSTIFGSPDRLEAEEPLLIFK